MNTEQILFYILSAFVLGTALLSVTTRKIFRAAIWLLFSLTGIAGLYFWLNVEFVAAVQIIVYVGGIVVLIIFSIFLTQQAGLEMPVPVKSRAIFSLLAASCGFLLSGILLSEHTFSATPGVFSPSVADIGTQMLSVTSFGYVLPFEVVSVLLLAAMIGSIVIAMKIKHPQQASGEAGREL